MMALQNLLIALEVIEIDHYEIEDTDVRAQMYDAVYHAFIKQTPGYRVPDSFGMFEGNGNRRVNQALSRFARDAAVEAIELRAITPEQRFEAFENSSIVSVGGKSFDDFFGSATTYEKAKLVFD